MTLDDFLEATGLRLRRGVTSRHPPGFGGLVIPDEVTDCPVRIEAAESLLVAADFLEERGGDVGDLRMVAEWIEWG